MPEGKQMLQNAGSAPAASQVEANGATLVKPVVNTIRILRHLSTLGHAQTVTEISRQLQINASTCYGILRTLVAEEVLQFDERNKCYSIGLDIVRLAQNALSEEGKLSITQPRLQRIADEFNISLTLWSLKPPARMVLVGVAQGNAAVQIQMRIGQRLPLFLGAAGRLVAQQGGYTQEEVREQFERLHWDTPLSFDNYWKQSLAAKRQGWALDEGTFARGVTSIAVPMYGRTNVMGQVLVATMFEGRHKRDELMRIADTMIKVAKDVGPAF